MSCLEGLVVGDRIMVHDSQERYRRQVVARVGRVWLYDSHGDKYRIADGRGEERLQYGAGVHAVTVAEWEVLEETERLRVKLASWGWVPGRACRKLTLPQQRRAAALLDEFEAEGSS
jgi:hypothetical protein